MKYFLREISVEENMVHIEEISLAIEEENKALRSNRKKGGR